MGRTYLEKIGHRQLSAVVPSLEADAGVQAGDAVTIKEGKTDEVVGLTSDFITELAKNSTKLATLEKEEVTELQGNEAQLNLAPGTWLILVTGGTTPAYPRAEEPV